VLVVDHGIDGGGGCEAGGRSNCASSRPAGSWLHLCFFSVLWSICCSSPPACLVLVAADNCTLYIPSDPYNVVLSYSKNPSFRGLNGPSKNSLDTKVSRSFLAFFLSYLLLGSSGVLHGVVLVTSEILSSGNAII